MHLVSDPSNAPSAKVNIPRMQILARTCEPTYAVVLLMENQSGIRHCELLNLGVCKLKLKAGCAACMKLSAKSILRNLGARLLHLNELLASDEARIHTKSTYLQVKNASDWMRLARQRPLPEALQPLQQVLLCLGS